MERSQSHNRRERQLRRTHFSCIDAHHWIVTTGWLEKQRDGMVRLFPNKMDDRLISLVVPLIQVRSGWTKRFFVLTPAMLYYFHVSANCFLQIAASAADRIPHVAIHQRQQTNQGLFEGSFGEISRKTTTPTFTDYPLPAP